VKSRWWLVAVLLKSPLLLYAEDACEQQDADLVNQLESNIVFETARTADDFLNESLRYFFTDLRGGIEFTLLISDLTLSEWGRYFTFIGSEFDYSFVVCNDIGQCAQGTIISQYSKMPNSTVTDATNSVLDWLTGGSLSISKVFFAGLVKHEFIIKTGDGDASNAEVIEGTPRQILAHPEDYPVREEGDPLTTDKRCRNNYGELLDSESDPPPGGDGYVPPLTSPSSPGYWLRIQSGWRCYADETGVVCKRTYDYVWVDW